MIELRSWSDDDLPILEKTLGDQVMMKHLGGPENPAQIVARHARFLEMTDSSKGTMFTIWLASASATVGTIGFWESTWRDEHVYETGWMVLPGYQGRGIASKAASAIVARASAERKHRFLHAFPSVSNIASNVVCENAGFVKLGECTFEYPKGHFMQCNDWRVDLFAAHTSIEEQTSPGNRLSIE
ncbi:MAG: GNAT family N-acetyltransferase [Vulcanimicrobiaceae bacterium]